MYRANNTRSRLRGIVLILASVFLLAGCGGQTHYIDTTVEGVKLRAPDPKPIVMQDIEFIIISEENINEYIPQIASGDLTLFALEADGYKNLSINTMQLLNYIKSQKQVIAAYREFYER